MSAPTRFPLVWPETRKRRAAHERKSGNFKSKGPKYLVPVSIAVAYDRLISALDALGATDVLISSDIPVGKRDQRPLSGSGEPIEPGIAVYFDLGNKEMEMACDTYTRAAQNMAALAAHIEATRAITRYGVQTAAEALAGFLALPAPPQTAPERPWWEVLGVIRESTNIETVQAVYRTLARMIQNEPGDRDAALMRLNIARDAAVKELS